jgi:hypothetical protein
MMFATAADNSCNNQAAGTKRRVRLSTFPAPNQTVCSRPGLAVGRPAAPGPVPQQDEFSWPHSFPGSAQRGLSDREENGTAKHAEHAKGGGALQV